MMSKFDSLPRGRGLLAYYIIMPWCTFAATFYIPPRHSVHRSLDQRIYVVRLFTRIKRSSFIHCTAKQQQKQQLGYLLLSLIKFLFTHYFLWLHLFSLL